MNSNSPDLSVIIPALNEARNLTLLLPQLHLVLKEQRLRSEIIVVTTRGDRETIQVATQYGARAVEQQERGYGGALLAGFAAASGGHVLTMDADLSHPPIFIRDLWAARDQADVNIASRYVRGGGADMPLSRYVLSRVLNVFFSRGLALRVRDMSSGFRLYKADVVRGQPYLSRDFNVLQEILVRAYAEGWRVGEVPFRYAARQHGQSHARVLHFGIAYLRTFRRLWNYRNSILAADYDDRAYDSDIPLQRYWQRARFRHVTALIGGQGRVLDVGCGSSRIISQLPNGSAAVDILFRKLRYARRFARPLVHGSGFALPFPDQSFPCVLCSQVIEHVPKTSPILDELDRVLMPDGRLVIGTPDYDHWEWRATEKLYGSFAPGGYADEHIAHYGRRELMAHFAGRGYQHEATHYILQGELILAFRKRAAP